MSAALDGQRAIVTGAVGALGSAVVTDLRRVGAHVVGLDARPGADYVVDLTSAQDVESVVRAITHSAAVHVLVHCAAVARERRLEETTPEEWAHVLGTNAGGTFHLLRAVLPHMRDNRYGRVLAIGSIASDFGYAFPAYSASKAAVLALVKSAAVQYATSGVTVNCLSPGRIATPLAPASSAAELRTRIPVGRAAEPEEISSVAVSLVLPTAGYLTGANVVCDGGMSSVFALHGLGPYEPVSSSS